MTLELLAAAAVVGCLILYVISGGADFGGGVWDLLARGPRAEAQRRLIAAAIAPIWEANHVWMIAAIVLLFTCFPAAFAAISTFLHVPLTLALLGIVMRGAAFVFRQQAGPRSRWSAAFSIASLLTPLFLGMAVGALASGRLPLSPDGRSFAALYLAPWLAPFPLAVGIFTVVLFAFLAAVYLTLETEDGALRDDFRARALASGVALGAAAGAALLLAQEGAPRLRAGLTGSWWSPWFQAATGAAALGALAALWKRRFAWARVLAAVQAGLILLGWTFSQAPYIAFPSFTWQDAAPRAVLRPVLGALVVAGALVGPSFVYLYTVFRKLR